MNLTKCEELDKNVITKEIKKKETPQECTTIGPKKWTRVCPKCNNILFCSDKKSRNKANKNNVSCKKCSYKCQRKYVPDNLLRQCIVCKNDIQYKNRYTFLIAVRKNSKCDKCCQNIRKNKKPYTRNCPFCNRVIEHKQKSHLTFAIKNKRKCKYCANNHSNDLEFRKKQRLAKINYLKRVSNFQLSPTFNERACEYFDNLNIINSWSLIHAKNGGEFYIKEIGYWIDAYDKERNIVVEYDEPRHYDKNGNLRKKDIDRMNEICKHLSCQFWRYNEKLNKLIKYN